MANNSYVIVLKNETQKADKKTTATTTTSSGQSGDTAFEQLKRYVAPMAVVGYARSIADRIISSNISLISLTTGYEERQQRAQLMHSVGKQVIDVGISIGLGAKTGGVVGAIAGLTLSATNKVIDFAIRTKEDNVAKGVESQQRLLNQIRMGAGMNRRGTER